MDNIVLILSWVCSVTLFFIFGVAFGAAMVRNAIEGGVNSIKEAVKCAFSPRS